MTRSWRIVVTVGIVLAVAAAACSNGNDDEARSRRTTSTASTESTTATNGATTTIQAEGPAEWVAIVQDLYNRRHRLRTHPDPETVASVISEGCDCYDSELSTVEFFVERDLRYESRANQVLSVAVTGKNPNTRLTFLRVEVRPFVVRLYNPDGTLFQETDAPPPGQVNLAVAPTGPNGEWRIHDLVSFGPEE